MKDQQKLPWFAELNRGLRDTLDLATLEQRIVVNVAMLRNLAAEILEHVRTLGPVSLDDLPALAALRGNSATCLLREAA